VHAPQVAVVPMNSQGDDPVPFPKPADSAVIDAPVDSEVRKATIETPNELTDEERSKNSTPLTAHQGDLGDTCPAGRKVGDEAQSDVSASPKSLPNDSTAPALETASPLPAQAEPLPAPIDIDSMKLPVHEESVPYWERLAPLPAPSERPGTSSRRPGSSAGKLVVYQTEKQKKLKAESKKKREAEISTSPTAKLPPVVGARSALPPLKERKKKSKKVAEGPADSPLVLAPVKPVRDWKGSSGGEAWEVEVVGLTEPPAPEVLKFESPLKEAAEASA